MAKGLDPDVPTDRLSLIAVITADFDESDNDGLTTLAGWVGHPMAWGAFALKWREMVDKAPHKIAEFQIADLMHGRGEFADTSAWTRDERRALILQATDIIVEPDPATGPIAAVGCTIVSDLTIPNDLKVPSPYVLWHYCLDCCFMLPFELFPDVRDGNHTINFIFDAKETVRSVLNDLFFRVKQAAPPEISRHIGNHGFVDSKDLPALQAADFIAYERRLQTKRRLAGIRGEREFYGRLKKGRGSRFKILDDTFAAIIVEAQRAASGSPSRPPIYPRIPYEPD